MSISPHSSDVQRAYAKLDDILPLIAPHTISGPSAQGDVLITGTRVNDTLRRFSRVIDGRLASLGVRAPMPDVNGGQNPSTPQIVRDWVMYRTAAEVCLWAVAGNAKTRKVLNLLALADEICAVDKDGVVGGSILGESFIQYVHQESLSATTLDSPASEFGQFGSTSQFRLRNPGLIIDAQHPLKFVDSNNVEIFDSAGHPYSADIVKIDAAQSVIFIVRRTQILAAATGGVNYWFTWRDPSRFCSWEDERRHTGIEPYAP